MRHYLLGRAAAAAMSVAMLTSAALTAGAGHAAAVDAPECYAPVIDPVSRLYTELGIVEIPGAVLGPPRPTCEAPPEPVMPL